MGTLFIVATPIGNLEDITLRALRVLREVRLIAAEDTRHTRKLLNHYEIQTHCISYHEFNKLARLDDILDALAQGDVALVSDAGTPALSDPGFELVNACVAAGFTVSPVPGPSAPVAAIVASGLPTERFLYLGFLPRRAPERKALLADLADLTVSLVCFEAPHRLTDSLSDALSVLGDRRVVLAKDLTKLYENLLRMRISEALAHFSAQQPRGEYTLVIEGRVPSRPSKRDRLRVWADQIAEVEEGPSEAEVARRLRELRAQGKNGSAAAKAVARDLGLQKGLVYQVWLSLAEE